MTHDKIAAVYVFCANYHSGMNSRLYELQSKISKRFRPILTDRAWEEIMYGTGDGSWLVSHDLYLRMILNLKLGKYKT
jgi:hypothetical protein